MENASLSLRPETNDTENQNFASGEIEKNAVILFFLIILFGTITNIAALVATLKMANTQKNSTNRLVVALTITDLYGIAVAALPTFICYVKGSWVGGDASCVFQVVSISFVILSSGFLAAAMSFERLLAISKPFWYRNFASKNKTNIVILSIWLSCLAVALSILFLKDACLKAAAGSYCEYNASSREQENIAHSLLIITLGLIMIVVIFVSTIFIIVKLVQTRKQRNSLARISFKNTNFENISDLQNKENKLQIKSINEHDLKRTSHVNGVEKELAKAVIAVATINFICWVPLEISMICSFTGTWVDSEIEVHAIRLLFFNFVMDPFLYTLLRKQCRDLLKGWLCSCCLSKCFSRFSRLSNNDITQNANRYKK